MDFSEIVSVSGLSGLYKSVAQRPNGMVVCQIGEKDAPSKFVSNRLHTFTSLDNISIYTAKDNQPLDDVLREIKKQAATNPPVDATSSDAELKKYFTSIVPDYDTERVYISDIKKLLKWYTILDKNKLITPKKESKKKGEEEDSTKKTTGSKDSDKKSTSKKPAKKSAIEKKPAKAKVTNSKTTVKPRKAPVKK